jgi:hypothetical protein
MTDLPVEIQGTAELTTPPLPLRWLTAGVEDREHHDDSAFHGEVHGVWKPTKQRATDADRRSWYRKGPAAMRPYVARS